MNKSNSFSMNISKSYFHKDLKSKYISIFENNLLKKSEHKYYIQTRF